MSRSGASSGSNTPVTPSSSRSSSSSSNPNYQLSCCCSYHLLQIHSVVCWCKGEVSQAGRVPRVILTGQHYSMKATWSATCACQPRCELARSTTNTNLVKLVLRNANNYSEEVLVNQAGNPSISILKSEIEVENIEDITSSNNELNASVASSSTAIIAPPQQLRTVVCTATLLFTVNVSTFKIGHELILQLLIFHHHRECTAAAAAAAAVGPGGTTPNPTTTVATMDLGQFKTQSKRKSSRAHAGSCGPSGAAQVLRSAAAAVKDEGGGGSSSSGSSSSASIWHNTSSSSVLSAAKSQKTKFSSSPASMPLPANQIEAKSFISAETTYQHHHQQQQQQQQHHLSPLPRSVQQQQKQQQLFFESPTSTPSTPLSGITDHHGLSFGVGSGSSSSSLGANAEELLQSILKNQESLAKRVAALEVYCKHQYHQLQSQQQYIHSQEQYLNRLEQLIMSITQQQQQQQQYSAVMGMPTSVPTPPLSVASPASRFGSPPDSRQQQQQQPQQQQALATQIQAMLPRSQQQQQQQQQPMDMLSQLQAIASPSQASNYGSFTQLFSLIQHQIMSPIGQQYHHLLTMPTHRSIGGGVIDTTADTTSSLSATAPTPLRPLSAATAQQLQLAATAAPPQQQQQQQPLQQQDYIHETDLLQLELEHRKQLHDQAQQQQQHQ